MAKNVERCQGASPAGPAYPEDIEKTRWFLLPHEATSLLQVAYNEPVSFLLLSSVSIIDNINEGLYNCKHTQMAPIAEANKEPIAEASDGTNSAFLEMKQYTPLPGGWDRKPNEKSGVSVPVHVLVPLQKSPGGFGVDFETS